MSCESGTMEVCMSAVWRRVVAVVLTGFIPATAIGSGGAVDPSEAGKRPATETISIHGRVVDEDGLPIAGAELVATHQSGSRRPLSGVVEHCGTTRSDARGSFRLRRLVPGELYALVIERSGFARQQQNVVAPGGGESTDIEVVLERGSRGYGLVVDTADRAVAGAEVILGRDSVSRRGDPAFEGRATTDDEGRFEVAHVAAGRYRLEVVGTGYAPFSMPGVEVSRSADDVDHGIVALEPGVTVEGWVVDPEGRPVAGAGIFVEIHGKERSRGAKEPIASSGEDGRFVIADRRAGERLDIVARLDGFLAAERSSVEVPPSDPLLLTLQLLVGWTVSGVVVDSLGQPVAGAEVRLAGGPRRDPVWSGSDGAFELSGVADGTYALRAGHDDFADAIPEEVVVAGRAVEGLVLELAPGATILGRLLGLAAEELAALEVRAYGGALIPDALCRGEVDAGGGYRIPHVAAGRWLVEAETGDGSKARAATTVHPGDREVVLDLDFSRGHTLSGRVMRGGQPVTGVEIRLFHLLGFRNTESDGLGRYSVAGLAEGHYRIDVRRKSLLLRREIEISADLEIELELQTARVTGRVLDSSGAPVEGAEVRLAQPGDESLNSTLTFDDGKALSLPDGAFDLGEVAAGQWRIVAHKLGYTTAEARVDLVAGLDTSGLELRLEPTEGIRLTLTREAGFDAYLPIKAAVLDAAGQPILMGTYLVDDRGRVHVSDVPVGTWELVVRDHWSATVQLAVTVPGDPLRIALQADSRLRIEVADLVETPAWASAELRRADGSPLRFLLGGELFTQLRFSGGSTYAFGLSAGTWSVSVRADDGRVWTAEVAVTAGEEASVRLE